MQTIELLDNNIQVTALHTTEPFILKTEIEHTFSRGAPCFNRSEMICFSSVVFPERLIPMTATALPFTSGTLVSLKVNSGRGASLSVNNLLADYASQIAFHRG